MENSLTWKDLVALEHENKLPPTLVQRWRKRTGRDIQAMMSTWRENQLIWNRRLGPLHEIQRYSLLCTLFLPFFAILSSLEIESRPIAPFFGWMGAISLVIYMISIPLDRYYYKLYRRPDYDYSFEENYARLAEWAEVSPDRLAMMREHELEQLATGILTSAAAQVLTCAESDPYPGHVGDDKRALMDDLEYKYDTLRDLGLLTRTGYGPYYEGAKRILEVISKQI